MTTIRQDKNIIDIQQKLNEVMKICKVEHDEKIQLKAENYDLQKQLEEALEELNVKIKALEESEEKAKFGHGELNAKQRELMTKALELQEDIHDFAKKINSVAYSLDIKRRNAKK